MRRIPSRVTLGLLTLSFAAGCGLENSLVGGRCRDGMVLTGTSCATPEGITLITPADPPWTASVEGVDRGGTKTATSNVVPQSNDVIVEQTFPSEDPPAELPCTAPLVACHGACIPVAADAANCGACGKICPSNICLNGECQGATPGDIVLIGHDYTNANPGSAQTKVLVNALTIPTTDPIRVLSFEDGASVDAVAQTKSLATGALVNRKLRFTRAGSASTLTASTLGRDYDIVIIHDASAVSPVTTGASWADSLGRFAAKGGVIVALDRGTSPMPELLSSAGLMTVASHTQLAEGSHLVVSAAADVIGAQVLSPYAAFGPPVSFQGLPTPSDDLTWVVRGKAADGTLGDAIVVHRIVR